MKRIAWFFTDWSVNAYRQENDLYGGIAYYRVIKPAQILRKWFDIEVIGAAFKKWGVDGLEHTKYARLAEYDLIISKHLTNAQMASNILATGKHFGKKVIVDVDDNYFGVREDNPAIKDYGKGKEGRYNVGAFLSLADGVTVSTSPLKGVYKTINPHIDVLPNCCDINDWPNVRKMWDDGKIRIGFAGGLGHLDDLNIVLEPMSYILAKYPNVTWEIIGALWPQEAMEMVNKMNAFCKKNIASQVKISAGTMAWQGYPELLTSFGWDIVLAPLVDGEFNRGKSHIRWLESSMIHCPVVASPAYPYKEKIFGVNTIEDGKTGLFASTSEEWYRHLSNLVLSKTMRQEIAHNAYEYVKDNWQYVQWEDKWKKVIDKYT